ncbi:MAG: diguanylate cyclase, partial [Lachnospiraceae bacterium]|nr:diguanylate cyclase [Lachnospiraceae bacterium]
SKLIEKVFVNSPVYRIGGDEFVVLLEDEDYRNASRRLDTLEQAMRETGTGIGTRVSIAWGMAVYDGQNEESYERLFHRADKAMYERKARMKKGWSENAETV